MKIQGPPLPLVDLWTTIYSMSILTNSRNGGSFGRSKPDWKIEVRKVPSLREAFSQRKTAKMTVKEFEDMTREVLGS